MFTQDFSCPMLLFLSQILINFVYKTFTFFGWPSQTILLSIFILNLIWALSISLAATLKIEFFLSFRLATQMFQFTNSPLLLLCIHNKILEVCSSRFPHSDIPGLTDICSSPRLFAAYHVLLRLSVPRHSPYALGRLTRNILLFNFQVSWWR